MKKIIAGVLVTIVISLLSSFDIFSSGGEIGRTGSPGEVTCSFCHSGGPAGTSVSITAVPDFTNNVFDPNTTYTITITVNHPSQPAFGFDCEILGEGNINSGVMSNGGSGVQFATVSGRKNATHTAAKSGSGSASFTFQWVPPVSLATATIFVCGNAVNANGNSGGDIAATARLDLTSLATNIVATPKNEVSKISLFPNPARDLTSLSYMLLSDQQITIDLLEISGKKVKTLVSEVQEAGQHSNILDLKGISSGIYFVRTSVKGEKVSQKLISIQ